MTGTLDAVPGAVMTPLELARRLAGGLAPGPGGVLDPACGEGELLLAAFEAAGRDARWASEALHGIELDAGRLETARARLRAAIGGSAGERVARRLVQADALDPDLAWPQGTAILANPPWASLSGRQAVAVAPARRALWRRTYASFAGWPSLHAAFLERIASHVGTHGTRARVLLPAAVAEGERYAALRAAVTRWTRLTAPPEHLGEDAFPGVVEPALSIELAPRPGEPLGESPGESRGESAPWVERAPAEARFLQRLAAFPRLAAECFGDPGVHTGNAAADLIVRDGAPGLPPIREGRDLAAFRLGAAHARLRTTHEARPGQRFRIGRLARYRSVPVLVRQTAARPIAALHDAPTYFRNTLLACRPPADLDPAFVVAVLNSSVAAAWHRLSFADARQRTFPQVKVRHLRDLPFPLARRADDPAAHDAIAACTRELQRGETPALRASLEQQVHAAFQLASGAVPGLAERS